MEQVKKDNSGNIPCRVAQEQESNKGRTRVADRLN